VIPALREAQVRREVLDYLRFREDLAFLHGPEALADLDRQQHLGPLLDRALPADQPGRAAQWGQECPSQS
jgi:hypothetical protein